MSILALDARKRWEQRKAHAAGEAFDSSVEELPESTAALDVMWAGGHGTLTERQFKAGDWLRTLVNGHYSPTRGGERVQGGCINPVERKAVNDMHNGTLKNAAMDAAERRYPGAYGVLDTMLENLTLRGMARRHSIHHDIMARRFRLTLDALADYKYGNDADADAWNTKASTSP